MSFTCVSCKKTGPECLRYQQHGRVCQLCWLRQYPVLPSPPVPQLDVLRHFILHPDLSMVHLPRTALRCFTREYDAWTLPSRPLKDSPTLPPTAVYLWGVYIPDASDADIEVTPVMFQSGETRNTLLGQKLPPFLIQDDGSIRLCHDTTSTPATLFHNFLSQ